PAADAPRVHVAHAGEIEFDLAGFDEMANQVREVGGFAEIALDGDDRRAVFAGAELVERQPVDDALRLWLHILKLEADGLADALGGLALPHQARLSHGGALVLAAREPHIELAHRAELFADANLGARARE